MASRDEILESLETDGACLWIGQLDEGRLRSLETRLTGGPLLERRPIGLEILGAWLGATFLPDLAAAAIGPGARPVRALLMGKTGPRPRSSEARSGRTGLDVLSNPGVVGEAGDENWAIPFHQDTTLALRKCLEVPGFGPWVNKAHFYHAQAPATVMEGMLATRIHLDDCGPENGPLKVIRGSHRFGKLDDSAIAASIASNEVLTLCAARGEVVLMKPLVLHGSDRAIAPASRRVLHIEWAAADLPGGLEWAWF